MIHAHLFRAGQPPVELDSGALDMAHANDGNSGDLVWLDVETPSEQELQQILGPLDLDAHAAAILRRPNRRPFVRVYREHFLVVALSIEVSEEHEALRSTSSKWTWWSVASS